MAKNIRCFLENLLEFYFLNIIVNVNFFNDLKLEYYGECYPEILKALNKKLEGSIKIDWSGHKVFSEKITGP